MTDARLKVLLILSHVDGNDVGEALVGYRWAKEIAKRCDVTMLTQTRKGHQSPVEQFPECRVITWPTVELPARFERVNALMKPGYPIFVRRVRKWIKAAIKRGEYFDVIHQLNPIGIRHAPASSNYGVPFVFGPAGGSLSTPASFKKELGAASWYTKLRMLDAFLFKYSFPIRNAYRRTDLLIGVGAYVKDSFDGKLIKKFAVQTELGLNHIHGPRPSLGKERKLTILHVGRAVRTKGLRDVIRALSYLKKKDIHLLSAGAGEDLDICKQEAIDSDVIDHVTFYGSLPHDEVMNLYEKADLFVFPSFREPSGGVVFEALGAGLPVIVANRGGPGDYLKDNTGVKIEVTDPNKFPQDIANAIDELYTNRNRLAELAHNGNALMQEIALWDKKMDWLMATYDEVIADFKKRHQ